MLAWQLEPLYDAVLLWHGGNGTYNTAQTKAALLVLGERVCKQNKPLIVLTITARTSSTAQFMDIVRQTPSFSPSALISRANINDWLVDPGASGFVQQLRAVVPGAQVSVVDVAGVQETNMTGVSVPAGTRLTPQAGHTNSLVTFANVHGFWPGDMVVPLATVAGALTVDTMYYAGPWAYNGGSYNVYSPTQIGFYDTRAHAIAGGATGLVALTGDPGTLIRVGGYWQPTPLATAFGGSGYTFTVSGMTNGCVGCPSGAALCQTITCTAANATQGAVYRAYNGALLTVWATIAGQTTLKASGVAPPSAGVLTLVSGTGDATITYSAVSSATTVYTNNGNSFWPSASVNGSGTQLNCSASGAPTGGATTLTLSAGFGDATISVSSSVATFSSATASTYVAGASIFGGTNNLAGWAVIIVGGTGMGAQQARIESNTPTTLTLMRPQGDGGNIWPNGTPDATSQLLIVQPMCDFNGVHPSEWTYAALTPPVKSALRAIGCAI